MSETWALYNPKGQGYRNIEDGGLWQYSGGQGGTEFSDPEAAREHAQEGDIPQQVLEPADDGAPTGWSCMLCGVALPGPAHDHDCEATSPATPEALLFLAGRHLLGLGAVSGPPLIGSLEVAGVSDGALVMQETGTNEDGHTTILREGRGEIYFSEAEGHTLYYQF